MVGLNAKATIRASGSQGKVETYRPGLNVGGLVGENQIQGRIVSSMSEGTVSGDYYVSMGGLAGVNLGSI
ncbi:hypothetical protein F7P00_31040, partial [Pseudomonas aeruginosa]